MQPESRPCTKCAANKPLSEFSKAPRGKHGRKSTCKACDASRSAANFQSRALPPEEVARRHFERRGESKRCTKCLEDKPRTEFYKSHDGKYGPVLKSICKLCHTAQVRGWYGEHSDRSNTNRRRLQLKQNYGLTPDEYDAMLSAQGGVCAICKRPERVKRQGKLVRMPVDHCHETGRVRALLCHSCNRAIGLLGDDTELLRAATEYLLRHKAEAVQ
ncbi:endonuclease VII domain-containing protein [Streptomyces lasiicapitis]|uniref:endonuclease VII domain-containing protein n=1 Tax=Streptomyces lasiicapitis TaxID=1923961 RepID=UPI00365B1B67